MLGRTSPPPDPSTLTIKRLMVASEGRPIAYPVLVKAMELARPEKASIFVMTIARVWGTSLGFPNPGLQPSKAEWTEQRLIARHAVDAFEKAGFDSYAVVLATRRARKRVLQEARHRDIDAIVMGCDRNRGLVGDFLWSHEPYRVARKARIPVYLVPLEEAANVDR